MTAKIGNISNLVVGTGVILVGGIAIYAIYQGQKVVTAVGDTIGAVTKKASTIKGFLRGTAEDVTLGTYIYDKVQDAKESGLLTWLSASTSLFPVYWNAEQSERQRKANQKAKGQLIESVQFNPSEEPGAFF